MRCMQNGQRGVFEDPPWYPKACLKICFSALRCGIFGNLKATSHVLSLPTRKDFLLKSNTVIHYHGKYAKWLKRSVWRPSLVPKSLSQICFSARQCGIFSNLKATSHVHSLPTRKDFLLKSSKVVYYHEIYAKWPKKSVSRSWLVLESQS